MDSQNFSQKEIILGAVGEPLPVRLEKIFNRALELGWELNPPGATFVVRLAKPCDELAKPFFIRWDIRANPETGKRSWRFAGARASNGQKMNLNDVSVYLEDSSMIWEELPDEQAADHPSS